MNTVGLGRLTRVIRLRQGLRQQDVADRARVSRSAVSLLERGQWSRLSVGTVDAVLLALDARWQGSISWNGPELDRLIDARHAALAASIKERLERWAWQVRVEASYSRYGERGRIDLLAWHPISGILLVVEIKTDLIDVQALLGAMDAKTRLARHVADPGWRISGVVPAIVFMEDRTTRRRLDQLHGLFDRYELRGQPAITWLRRPTRGTPPRGLLWFRSLPNARLVRISGQRVRIPRHIRPR